MCDAYVAFGETSEQKTLGDKYLDRGAIDQAMQGNVLLVGSSDGTFTNQAEERGVYDGGWAWNAKFADLDNDEWQDLYVVNGWWLEIVSTPRSSSATTRASDSSRRRRTSASTASSRRAPTPTSTSTTTAISTSLHAPCTARSIYTSTTSTATTA